jgi:hypothetical protein
VSEGYNTKQDLNKYVHQNSLMRTRSDLYLFSESLWVVRTGSSRIWMILSKKRAESR